MSPTEPIDLKTYIRDIPDFPKPGIRFRDITPLLGHPPAFQAAVRTLAAHFEQTRLDALAAVEARGFLFAAPLAIALGVGLVPIRKPGKLPYQTRTIEYALEYGTDRVEMHSDALAPGHRVLMVDDVLATGGTMKACCDLVQATGAEIVGCAFLIELAGLRGRDRLDPWPIFSVISY